MRHGRNEPVVDMPSALLTRAGFGKLRAGGAAPGWAMEGPCRNSAPVFHVHTLGALANQMIQYMVALKFVDLMPECRISNIDMPLWGIRHPPIDGPGPMTLERDQQHIDLPRLAAAMQAGEICRIDWQGYGQRMENFLPRERYRAVFVPPAGPPLGYGPEFLVCHVRVGENLDGSGPFYPLTPVEFYADLIERTGLRPVFMGQTGANPYTDRLRARFPNAIFRAEQDVLTDFETIRQSKNLVVGVSTFTWLAAWLSDADSIHLLVNGLFNPMQVRVVDLLPFGDSRYQFWLFPVNFAMPLADYADLHRRLQPYWRWLPHAQIQQQFAQAPRFERTLEMMLSAFDEAFYVAENRDVARVLREGYVASGRDHYQGWGFREWRYPFALDRRWYAAQYPLAGFELSQGDYTDFTHHYVAVGRDRGYRPVPPGR